MKIFGLFTLFIRNANILYSAQIILYSSLCRMKKFSTMTHAACMLFLHENNNKYNG